jgi:hypothetical protein
MNVAFTETVGKPIPDAPEDASHVEFLLALLRVARLRAKLAACEFDCVGVALRSGFTSYEGAIAWLDDAGLLDHINPPPDGTP